MAYCDDTIGSTGTFSSLASWDGSRATDLTASGGLGQAIARFQNETNTDTTAVDLSSWTTDSWGNSVLITHDTGARHDGTLGSGAGWHAAVGGIMLTASCGYVYILGVELFNTTDANLRSVILQGGANLTVDSCIIKLGCTQIRNNNRGISANASYALIKNNLIYNAGTEGIRAGSNTGQEIYHNTIVDCFQYGIYGGTYSVPASNNVVYNSGTTDYYLCSNFSGDSNADSDGSCTFGTNYFTLSGDPFDGYSGDDFRVSSGSELVDVTTASSVLSPDVDCIGTSRPQGTYYDIGWFEYVAGGTTALPTTLAPTTLAPTTLVPTTAAPTTLAPTTLAPTTQAPTTLAPTTVAPTTIAPTTLPPTTLAPTTLVPTTLPPTTIAPTTLAPTTLAPTTEAPTTAPPTTAAPTTAAPTTTAPTTIAPTTQAPTTPAPTTLAPTTEAPTTVAPTTLAPTTLPPTTLAPTTLAPTTQAPTTIAPTTGVPTTLAPTTLPPTTLAPTTLPPTTSAPTTTLTTVATTAAPTTLAPTTAIPTTVITTALPTTEPPTTEPPTAAPTTLAPTTTATEPPTTEPPTTSAPTTTVPTTLSPTTEPPQILYEAKILGYSPKRAVLGVSFVRPLTGYVH